jgi:hypothetical protein
MTRSIKRSKKDMNFSVKIFQVSHNGIADFPGQLLKKFPLLT